MAGHDELSPRAQSILATIERDAEERRRALAAGRPTPAPAGNGAPEPPARPARLPDSTGVAERLLGLVRDVVAETEAARARLNELNRALDQMSEQVALPPAPATTTPKVSRPLAPGRMADLPAAIRAGMPAASPSTAEPVAAPAPPAPARKVAIPAPPPLQPRHTPAGSGPAAGSATAPTGSPPRAAAPPPVAPPAPAAAIPDSARLIAIEMAVAGSSRGEVGRRLHAEFGIAEPKPVLDEVFGSGTTSDTRLPWGRS